MTRGTRHQGRLVLTALDGTEHDLCTWLTARLRAGAPPGNRECETGGPLFDFDLDSVRLLGLIGVVDEVFGLELAPDDVYTARTVDGLARRLVDRATTRGRGGPAAS
ncbi:acyl carrier protein [Streptomyces griseofuscus]|nr:MULTISPECIES: acyl carrier protein [unclassified Streptomyces]MBJ6999574.1 acyl carrier protein [Streptomyces sp. CRPSP2-6A1]SCG03313.1 Phosphopantetheine attachment site [Streptomyces sp. LamerLS-31b]